MVSYHPQDILNQYCGNCHQFHAFMKPKPKPADILSGFEQALKKAGYIQGENRNE
jgi:hypothetical protein